MTTGREAPLTGEPQPVDNSTTGQSATAAPRRWWLYDAPFAFGWASMGAILGVIFGWWALLVIFGLSVFIVVAPIRYRGSNRG